MLETLNTVDLWLGSFILSESDAELKDVRFCEGKGSVLFTFRGENLNSLVNDYFTEEALANVVVLRSKLNFLRDIIFENRKQSKLRR